MTMDKNQGRFMLLILCCMMTLLCACGVQEDPNSAAGSEEIRDLDSFYQSSVTQSYEDIRTLGKEYDGEQAQADRCFVIGAMSIYNEDIYTAFMETVQRQEDAFIRVAQTTTEGDLILDDIRYDGSSGRVYIVHDGTRDAFAAESDRIIALREYDNIAEYSMDGGLYWIAFDGTMETVDPDSTDTFVIARIN